MRGTGHYLKVERLGGQGGGRTGGDGGPGATGDFSSGGGGSGASEGTIDNTNPDVDRGYGAQGTAFSGGAGGGGLMDAANNPADETCSTANGGNFGCRGGCGYYGGNCAMGGAGNPVGASFCPGGQTAGVATAGTGGLIMILAGGTVKVRARACGPHGLRQQCIGSLSG